MSFFAHSSSFSHLGLGSNFKEDWSSETNTHFSYDLQTQLTKRRQYIFKIIEWLKENRTTQNIWFDTDVIFQFADDGKGRELNAETRKRIITDLLANPKVQQTKGKKILLAYKPTFSHIQNAASLHEEIKQSHSILESEVLDAYPGIEKDIQKLIQEECIYRIENKERKRFILFDRKKEFEMPDFDVDLKKCWHEVKMPTSSLVAEELKAQNLMSQKSYAEFLSQNSKDLINQVQKETKGFTDAEKQIKRRERNQKNKSKKDLFSSSTNQHLMNNPIYECLFQNPKS